MKLLSVLIPVYNEESTIYEVLERVHGVDLNHEVDKEIIVVNDLSTDNSLAEIERFNQAYPGIIQIVNHEINQGKGAGIRTCLEIANGDYMIIQDADLELRPEEYNELIQPVIDGDAEIVYGSRFINGKPKSASKLSNIANGFLTWLSNFVFRTRLTDMETCYKLVPSKLFKNLILIEDRFGFEPEITAKLAKSKALIKEVPISYDPRNAQSGKKIGWKDGFRAVYCILKYGWFTSHKNSFRSEE